MKTVSRWVSVLVVIGVIGIYLLMFLPYDIEEGRDKTFRIRVTWDASVVRDVEVVLTGSEKQVELLSDPPYVSNFHEFNSLENGDMVSVVQLKSGWNKRRLAHRFAVFKLAMIDGTRERRVVTIPPPEIIQEGEIRIVP